MNRFLPLSCLIAWLLIVIIGQKSTAYAQSDEDEGWRFGVVESYESPEEASELGVGWTRVRFQWAWAQEDGPGSWTPRVTDEQIDAEIAAGRTVVGLLIGIPDWARDENKLPQGLWLSHDNVDNTWANYVRHVVARFDGRIDHWVIWNEPDIHETEIAHSWDGSVADFAQLQRVAYQVAKEENPEAVIHLAAFTFWADHYAGTEQYMARLLDEIMADPESAANNYYFDVATAHLYFQSEQIYDLLGLFTGIMRDRGLEHPIWLVETNAPPINDPAWPVPDWFLSVNLDEQAAFVPQAMASALAAGAERMAIYKLQDTEDDLLANPEPFGLLRMDGSRRPAFTTYQIATQYLAGAYGAERERWDRVGQIRVDQPDQTTTVLFSRLPSEQRIEVKANDETATLVDMWGESRTITATKGTFEVMLPRSICTQAIGPHCMIGGTTYYLVQSADTIPPTSTPTATLTPSATATATPAATVTATATKTPTATAAATPTATVTATPTTTPSPIISLADPSELAERLNEATSTRLPDADGTEDAPVGSLGIWIIGGGLLIALAAGAGWLVSRQRS
jgi:hypothetical protein